MDEIKNNIITISGEPASGKSTVIKMLEEKYTKMGYIVHIEPIGHYWREAAVETYKKIKPEIQNVTLDEIHADPDFETFRKQIDLALDEKVRKRGEEINSQSRPNEVFIFDSRLAWKNIPSSYAVRLTVDEKIAGERVFNDPKRGNEDKYPTIEAATEATKTRKEEEIKRYKRRYGVDLADLENYNLVVDTSYSNIEELAGIIVDGENAYRKGKYYPKMWASPACFIGTQNDRQTSSASGFGMCSPKELAEKMKQEGFNPILGEIMVLENYGEKFVQDGHHRAMAVLAMGNTLIPYIVNDDERANKNMEYEQNNIHFAYDWSDCIRYFGGCIGNQKQFENFSVNNLTAYERRLKEMIEEAIRRSKEGR